MRKTVNIVLSVFFLIVFIVSGYMLAKHFVDAGKQAEQFDSLAEKVQEARENISSAQLEEKNEAGMLNEYADLYALNGDMVGWIRIDGTNINYPVMQSVNQPDFYLKRDFNKDYSDYGCPYADEPCDLQKPSDNIIIYGHHMNNGTMFAELEKFEEEEFWKEHRTISFDTLYEKQSYEIVAVFKTIVYTQDPNAFKYYLFVDADSPEDFEAYISRAKELALYDTGITAEYGDKLISLSTCEYSNDNGRLVVVAKRTD